MIIVSMYVGSWGCVVCSFLRPPPCFRILVFSVWGVLVVFCCWWWSSFLPVVRVVGDMPVIWWTVVAPPYP